MFNGGLKLPPSNPLAVLVASPSVVYGLPRESGKIQCRKSSINEWIRTDEFKEIIVPTLLGIRVNTAVDLLDVLSGRRLQRPGFLEGKPINRRKIEEPEVLRMNEVIPLDRLPPKRVISHRLCAHIDTRPLIADDIYHRRILGIELIEI